MNNVTIHRTNGTAAEYFEGVVGFNAGNTAIQLTTFDEKATILVLEASNIERIDMEPIRDEDIGSLSKAFQEWYAKQLELATENAKLQKEPVAGTDPIH